MTVKHHASNARRFLNARTQNSRAQREQEKDRIRNSSVMRTWLLFPRAFAPGVRELGILMSDSTASPYTDASVGEFVLAEMSDQESLEDFKETILMPLAEKLDVPLINLVLNINMPATEAFSNKDEALWFSHKLVWMQVEQAKILDQFKEMDLNKIFG